MPKNKSHEGLLAYKINFRATPVPCRYVTSDKSDYSYGR